MEVDVLIQELNAVKGYKAKAVKGRMVSVTETDKGFSFAIGKRVKPGNIEWIARQYLNGAA